MQYAGASRSDVTVCYVRTACSYHFLYLRVFFIRYIPVTFLRI